MIYSHTPTINLPYSVCRDHAKVQSTVCLTEYRVQQCTTCDVFYFGTQYGYTHVCVCV
jgi:hypothetical protein